MTESTLAFTLLEEASTPATTSTATAYASTTATATGDTTASAPAYATAAATVSFAAASSCFHLVAADGTITPLVKGQRVGLPRGNKVTLAVSNISIASSHAV